MTMLRSRLASLAPGLLVLAVALVLAACGSAAPAATESPPASATPATTGPSAEPVPQSLPPGATEVQPSSAPRSAGDAELITVFTHCGFEGRLDWAGSFWREVRRVPPGAAIGDPEDSGRITLLSPTEAVFESSTGVEVLLERVPGPVTLFPCD